MICIGNQTIRILFVFIDRTYLGFHKVKFYKFWPRTSHIHLVSKSYINIFLFHIYLIYNTSFVIINHYLMNEDLF